MMSFFRRISPTGAFADFATVWRRPTPHRWPILGVAAAATFAMFYILMPPNVRLPPALPQVSYISTWAPDRTRAEIIASNLENQKRQDALAAEQAKLEEQKKQMYRDLGRATGIDVDAMEADIKRQQAAEEAAKARAKAAVNGAPTTQSADQP